MVCAPTVRGAEKLAPVPNGPSKLETQASAADKSPSPGSIAAPANKTPTPAVNNAPSAGLLIETVGGTFVTVMVIVSKPNSLSEAVTDAVT